MSLTNDASELPLERKRGDRLGALRPEPDTEPRLLHARGYHRPRMDAPQSRRGDSFADSFVRASSSSSSRPALVAAGTIWSRHVMRAVLPTVDGTLSVDGLRRAGHRARNAQGVPSIHACQHGRSAVRAGLCHRAGSPVADGYAPPSRRRRARRDPRPRPRPARRDAASPATPRSSRPRARHRFRRISDANSRRTHAASMRSSIAIATDCRSSFICCLHTAPVDAARLFLVSLVMWQDLSTSFPQSSIARCLRRHLPPPCSPILSRRLLARPSAGATADGPYDTARDRRDPSRQDTVTTRTSRRVARPAGSSCAHLPHSQRLRATTAARARIARAVSGAHSASGKPLFSNDMHLGLSVPDIWYEAALISRELPAERRHSTSSASRLPVCRGSSSGATRTSHGALPTSVATFRMCASNTPVAPAQTSSTSSPMEHGPRCSIATNRSLFAAAVMSRSMSSPFRTSPARR